MRGSPPSTPRSRTCCALLTPSSIAWMRSRASGGGPPRSSWPSSAATWPPSPPSATSPPGPGSAPATARAPAVANRPGPATATPGSRPPSPRPPGPPAAARTATSRPSTAASPAAVAASAPSSPSPTPSPPPSTSCSCTTSRSRTSAATTSTSATATAASSAPSPPSAPSATTSPSSNDPHQTQLRRPPEVFSRELAKDLPTRPDSLEILRRLRMTKLLDGLRTCPSLTHDREPSSHQPVSAETMPPASGLDARHHFLRHQLHGVPVVRPLVGLGDREDVVRHPDAGECPQSLGQAVRRIHYHPPRQRLGGD